MYVKPFFGIFFNPRLFRVEKYTSNGRANRILTNSLICVMVCIVLLAEKKSGILFALDLPAVAGIPAEKGGTAR